MIRATGKGTGAICSPAWFDRSMQVCRGCHSRLNRGGHVGVYHQVESGSFGVNLRVGEVLGRWLVKGREGGDGNFGVIDVRRNICFKVAPVFTSLKMAFIQKVLMHLSFPQTDKPHYFPELEF